MNNADTEPDPQTALPITGPGAVQTFLYYFSVMTLIAAMVGAVALHQRPSSPGLFTAALTMGLLAGTLGALFNRTVRLTVAYDNQRKFTTKLNSVLTDLGFELDHEAMAAQPDRPQNAFIYHRPAPAKWFAGRVYVVFHPQSVTLASRAANMQKLQRRLA